MTLLITKTLNLMLFKNKKFFRKIRLKKLNSYLLDSARKPTYVTIIQPTIKEIKRMHRSLNFFKVAKNINLLQNA